MCACVVFSCCFVLGECVLSLLLLFWGFFWGLGVLFCLVFIFICLFCGEGVGGGGDQILES